MPLSIFLCCFCTTGASRLSALGASLFLGGHGPEKALILMSSKEKCARRPVQTHENRGDMILGNKEDGREVGHFSFCPFKVVQVHKS